MKKQKINLAIKVVSAVVIVVIAATALTAYLWRAFKKSDYFAIKDIVTSQDTPVDLSYLKGRNIFSVDLEKQARYLSDAYPVYRNIRLIRILPDRVFVEFVKRQPVAYIRLYKYFSVDRDCVLFDVLSMPQEANLPVILGLETKIFGPKTGKKFNVKELNFSLDIIKEVRSVRALRYWKIRKIDVTNPDGVSFFIAMPVKNPSLLPVGAPPVPEILIEIKINQGGIADKIGILTGMLFQLKNEWVNIKYIDLRFKEPVVKFKDKNVKR
ncbi:MAG: cell division protein FtsQ/DivIB [Deltaproteobacteria bacterium]